MGRKKENADQVTQVVTTAQETPAPKKMVWVLILSLAQDFMKPFTKTVTENGEKKKVKGEKPVKHNVEFREVTEIEPTAKSISNWLIAKLTHHQLLNKLQGKDAFDPSYRIDLTIQINGEVQGAGIKFSINEKKLETLLNDYPLAVGGAFNPKLFEHGTTKAAVLAFRKGYGLDKPLTSPVSVEELMAQVDESADQLTLPATTIDEVAEVVVGDMN
jgi:hypothetical protein